LLEKELFDIFVGFNDQLIITNYQKRRTQMFGRKLRKENRGLIREVKRLTEERKKEKNGISQLRERISSLTWENGKRIVVVDTNAVLHYQDLLLQIEGNLAFPWAVKEELLRFHEEALIVQPAIRRAIEDGVEGLEWISKLTKSERKAQKSLIGRAIVSAIKDDKIRRLRSIVKDLRYKISRRAHREGWTDEKFDEELHKEIRYLMRRSKQIIKAWPMVKKKFDICEWRTVGSDSGLYQEVMNSTESFRKNGNGENKNTDDDVVELAEVEERTLGDAIGSADSRVIAVVLTLKERFTEVILLTRDRRLGEAAEAKGIKVAFSVSDIEPLTKKTF